MILDRIAIEDNGGNFAFAKSSPIAVNLTSFRLQDSGENGWKKSAKNRVRAGKRERVRRGTYQFLVYPLIGLFLTVYFNTYVIHLASRALNKKTSRADQPRVVRILDNLLSPRFPK